VYFKGRKIFLFCRRETPVLIHLQVIDQSALCESKILVVMYSK